MARLPCFGTLAVRGGSPAWRRLTRSPLRALAVPAAALSLAGCAGTTTGGNSGITVRGKTLSIYLSQPPGGARDQPAADVLAAERLAFQQSGGRAGAYALRLHVLGGRELSANARTAIEDPTAIAYLGELVPGTSQISVEIANQQGLLEVSPLDTAAYLTQPVPPVSSTVDTFYPSHATFSETFARVVPNSSQEAKAIVAEMQSEHASSVYVGGQPGQRYGAALAVELRSAARAAGLPVTTSPTSAGAIFYGSSAASPEIRAAAARFLTRAASANPGAKLFIPSGLYDSSFVATLAPAVQARLIVSSPGFLPADLNAAGRAFVSAFTSSQHHRPVPQAVFGYEAARALVAVLDAAGAKAANRARVVAGFRSFTAGTASSIGAYSIHGGDPNLAPFVFARVRAGALVPFRFLALRG